jgi:hypothetical protein
VQLIAARAVCALTLHAPCVPLPLVPAHSHPRPRLSRPVPAVDYNATTGRVRARLPLYGYLMLQQALGGGASIVGRALAGECKAWLLKGSKAPDLRLLLINKDPGGKECGANFALSPAQLRRYADTGLAHYMYASAGVDERWRMYYSGAFFSLWGAGKEGAEELVPVRRYLARDKVGRVTGGGFALHLTANTLAALVEVPPATAAQKKAFDEAVKPPPASTPASRGGGRGIGGSGGGSGGSGGSGGGGRIASASSSSASGIKLGTTTGPAAKAPAGKQAANKRAL